MNMCRFLCENCGYNAEVADGLGATRVGISEAMICLDCRIVTNILVWTQIQKRTPDIGRCFKCKGTNLSKWADPYACPKCDQAMNKTPAGMAC